MTIYEANEIKALYKMNMITRKEAKERIKPYEEHFNTKSKELAKKYNQKPKLFSFVSFMR